MSQVFYALRWSFVQRDTTGLTTENTELKLRLQAMEQQAQLRDGEFLGWIYITL